MYYPELEIFVEEPRSINDCVAIINSTFPVRKTEKHLVFSNWQSVVYFLLLEGVKVNLISYVLYLYGLQPSYDTTVRKSCKIISSDTFVFYKWFYVWKKFYYE